jgi:hypothetical protein
MSEQELIRALQELIARHSPPGAPRRLSSRMMARDRWRVGLLTGATTLLWSGGIAGVLYMVFCFNRFIIATPIATPGATDELDFRSSPFGSNWVFHTKMELHHSLEACMAAVPALLLAGLSTVWLVFSSRRATLNQINMSLAEISEQLRQMRRLSQSPEGG